MGTDKQKIAKNTLYMYIRMFFIILIGFYSSRLILQNLGISDYGLYNVIGGTITLFAFLNTAMSQATQRYLIYENGKGDINRLKQIFCMCMNVHIIISFIIIIFAEIIGLWLLYNKLTIPENRIDVAFWVFQFSIVASVINITQVPYTASINAHERFNIFALISIIDAVLKLILVYCLKYVQIDRLVLYAFCMLCINSFTAILYRCYCIRNFKECKYALYWNKNDFKEMTSYTSWSLIGNFANTMSDQGVNILLNIFFGTGVNAARGIAIQIKTSIASLVYNFQGASIPQIIKTYAQKNYNEMIDLVFKTSKISFYLSFIAILPVWLELPLLLKIWLGEVPPHLIIFSRIILAGILAQSLGGTLQTVIQATGKIKRYQLTVGLINLSILPLSYLLLKLGCEASTPFYVALVISLLIVFTNLYNTFKLIKFPVRDYIKKIIWTDLKVFFCGIIIPLLIYASTNESIIRLIVIFFISLSTQAIVIFYLGLNKNERKWIINIISNKIKKQQ